MLAKTNCFGRTQVTPHPIATARALPRFAKPGGKPVASGEVHRSSAVAFLPPGGFVFEMSEPWAVTYWQNCDKAFSDVARDIYRVIEKMIIRSDHELALAGKHLYEH